MSAQPSGPITGAAENDRFQLALRVVAGDLPPTSAHPFGHPDARVPDWIDKRVILQSRSWIDRRAEPHRLDTMTPGYRANVLMHLQQDASTWVAYARTNELVSAILGVAEPQDSSDHLELLELLTPGWTDHTPLGLRLHELNHTTPQRLAAPRIRVGAEHSDRPEVLRDHDSGRWEATTQSGTTYLVDHQGQPTSLRQHVDRPRLPPPVPHRLCARRPRPSAQSGRPRRVPGLHQRHQHPAAHRPGFGWPQRGQVAMPDPGPSSALIVDVDGVVSPVHGHTRWGDDVVAGDVFGPVLVSPTLCRRLDQLAELPGVQACWLTSWPPHLRHRMEPFPGRTWPEITGRPGDPGLGWWKWAALLGWLDHNRRISKLAWCDDHLTARHLSGLDVSGSEESSTTGVRNDFTAISIAAIHAELARRGIHHLTVAPPTSTGINPQQVELLEGFLTTP